MSQLRTNSIVPLDGLPVGASGGGIIQCVQTVTTSAAQYNNTTFADIPAPASLSVSITPQSSSNKILVIGDISAGGASGSYNIFQLVRNSTNIYAGTDSKTFIGSKIWYPLSDGNSDGNAVGNINMVFLDSPATTSAVTYKVQVRVTSSTGAVNRRSTDDTSLASSLTVLEVSA